MSRVEPVEKTPSRPLSPEEEHQTMCQRHPGCTVAIAVAVGLIVLGMITVPVLVIGNSNPTYSNFQLT